MQTTQLPDYEDASPYYGPIGECAWVPVEELNNHPRNWVIHTAEQIADYQQLKARFAKTARAGNIGCAVLNIRDRVLIDGHMRLADAREQGEKELYCFLVDVSPEEAEVMLLSLRKIGQKAVVDEQVLQELLKAHLKDEEGLPPGWDAEEVGIALNGFSRAEVEEMKQGKDVPPPPESAPGRTKLGDIYRLDRHIVIVGDCTSTLTIVEALQQMGVGKVDLIYTDPPYNLGLSATTGRLPDKDGTIREQRPYQQKLRAAGIDAFDPVKDWLPTLPLWLGWKDARPAPDESFSVYVYCNDALVCDYTSWARAKNGTVTCLCWKKPRQPIPFAGHHHVDTENLLWLKKRAFWNDTDAAPDAFRGKCLTDGEISAEQSDSGCPCPKPVAQIANQLLLTTRPGGVVLDCFGYTGPTLMACEETGRRCLYIEHNPAHADICLLWWETMVGQKAILVGTLEGDSCH